MKRKLSLLLLISTSNFSMAQIDTAALGYIKYHTLSSEPDFASRMHNTSFALFNTSHCYAYYNVLEYIDLEAASKAQLKFIKSDKSNTEIMPFIMLSNKLENEDNTHPSLYSFVDTRKDTLYLQGEFLYTKTPNVRRNMQIGKVPFRYSNDSSMTILGYNCKKAHFTNETGGINVWYAEELPFIVSPNQYYGVPGAILRMQYDDALDYMQAVEINFKNTDALYYKSIKKPERGKLLDLKTFQKIQDENWENKVAADNNKHHYMD